MLNIWSLSKRGIEIESFSMFESTYESPSWRSGCVSVGQTLLESAAQAPCCGSVWVSLRRLCRLRGAEEDLMSRSVSCWIASFPWVGLCTESLSLPHHRLDHRVWNPQQLCDVVFLDQAVQDALPTTHTHTQLSGKMVDCHWILKGPHCCFNMHSIKGLFHQFTFKFVHVLLGWNAISYRRLCI